MEATTVNAEASTSPDEALAPTGSVPPLLIITLIPFIVSALLKPRFFYANKDRTAIHLRLDDPWTVVGGFIIWGFVFAFIVALYVSLAMQHSLLNFEKVVFVALCLKFSVIAWIISNHQHFILIQLAATEDDLLLARDELKDGLHSLQAFLQRCNGKLSTVTEEETVEATDLVRSFGPLAMMFLQNERSLFRWGLGAANFARKSLSFFGRLNK